MSQNLEKFNSPESSKLTPEEVEKKVKQFKQEHQGLVPEYSALPGEEKEEEREYPKEVILAYELKEFLKEIRPELENKILIKNAGEKLKSDIESSQKSGKTKAALDAWEAVRGYASYKQSGLWSKFDPKFRDWIEENIKDPQLIKNAEEELKSKIESGQKPGCGGDAWWAVYGYASFSQFQKILEEQGRKKEAIKESQKAMQPEKKLPPMPEEKAF